ncbi:hypothetical protein FIBSPDRAFT_901359 [Athelia psychrophila]|uniref:Uncharacterized protein n=1 Tax=Athelia psychrophila TaxID=1759441 RepID=A0A165X9D9_9AGAM|nr:hypothetical protein FIBSPDRAFT_901359 [Fibularhizoctonia sp. CBS 109695]
MASIPDYSEAQKTHRYHKYWRKLFESYFEAFPPPEPTADDTTDTASENESDSEPLLDSAEEEVFSKSAAGKRKQMADNYKSVKRAKKRNTKVSAEKLTSKDDGLGCDAPSLHTRGQGSASDIGQVNHHDAFCTLARSTVLGQAT